MHKTIALQNFDDDLLPLLSNADDRQEKCAYAFRKFSIESPRGQKYSERANDHRLIFCLCDSHALVRNIDLGALEVHFRSHLWIRCLLIPMLKRAPAY